MNWKTACLLLGSNVGMMLSSQAQHSKLVDSLLTVIDTARYETTIIDARNEIAYQWRYSNMEGAEEMACAALQLSLSENYLKGEGDAYMRLGVVMKNRGDYAEAISHYNEARRIRALFPNNEKNVASTHNTIGNVYRQIGEFREAFAEYEVGLRLLNSLGEDIRLKGNLLNGMAIASREIEKYDEALIYADSCIALRSKLKDSLGLANALMTSATIFTELENFEKATTQLLASLDIFQDIDNLRGQVKVWINLAGIDFYKKEYTSAANFYKQALAHPGGLNDFDKAEIWQGLGTLYQVQGKLDSAIIFFEQSLTIHKTQANPGGQGSLLYSIGDSYYDAQQYRAAIAPLNQALTVLPDSPLTDTHVEIYYSLFAAYSKLGLSDLAEQYAEKHIRAKEEVTQARDRALNYKLNYEEERRRRIVSEKEEALAKSEAQRSRQWIYIIGGGLGALLVIVIISFLWYFQKRKRKDAETKIDVLIKEQEIKANYARLQGEDKERKRLARDLHDRIGSMLSTVKLYFSALDSKIEVVRLEGYEQYQKAAELLDKTSDEVREVAHNLHSGVLSKFGLAVQLEDLADTIKDSQQMEVEITTHNIEGRMDSMLEVEVYRIAQELVNNVLKHAKASKLSIQLSQLDEVLNLIIEDNGIGFQAEKIKAKKGIGLENIRSRVHALNGTLQIDAFTGRGTNISIDIPIKNKADIF